MRLQVSSVMARWKDLILCGDISNQLLVNYMGGLVSMLRFILRHGTHYFTGDYKHIKIWRAGIVIADVKCNGEMERFAFMLRTKQLIIGHLYNTVRPL